MRRRLVIAGVGLGAVLILLGVWAAIGCPPPRLVLEYGLPPAGGPTGRTRIVGGIEFEEFAPGYCRPESVHFRAEKPSPVERLWERLASEPPTGHQFDLWFDWVEVRTKTWVSAPGKEWIQLYRSSTGRPELELPRWHIPDLETIRARWTMEYEGGQLRLAAAEEAAFASTMGPPDMKDAWLFDVLFGAAEQRLVWIPSGED